MENQKKEYILTFNPITIVMYYPGQVIMCINDFFFRDDIPAGITKPVEGLRYTVRDVVRSINEPDEYLIHLSEINKHTRKSVTFNGFQMWRFRPLDNLSHSKNWTYNVIQLLNPEFSLFSNEAKNMFMADESNLILNILITDHEVELYETIFKSDQTGFTGIRNNNHVAITVASPSGLANFLVTIQDTSPSYFVALIDQLNRSNAKINSANTHLGAEILAEYNSVLQLFNFDLGEDA